MSDFKNIGSSVIKISTDILFVRNPIGTSMGTVFGVVMHGLVNLFSPALQSIDFIKISALSVFHYIAIGIFGFNIKHMKSYHKVKPEIEEALAFIEEQQRKGNITKLEARQRYRELVATAVENAQLDNGTKEAIRAVRGFDENPN